MFNHPNLVNSLIKTFSHMWDVLSRKVGKRVAETLLIVLTITFVMEVFWLTMLVTIITLS